jgi:serine/threonine-protein kinase HipA
MKETGSDYSPDWTEVCRALAGDGVDGEALAEGLAAFGDALENAPRIALEEGANPEAIDRVSGRCHEVAEGLRELAGRPAARRG